MSTQGLIYFAHPKSVYGTGLEQRAMHALYVDGWDIVNPADHQAGYAERGMAHFIDLISTCEALAFMAFDDGLLGAGVAREVIEAQLQGMPIIKLDPVTGSIVGLTTPFDGVLTIDQTRKRLAA